MPEDEFEHLKRATARLIGGGSSGTGYLVADKRIATCEHVIHGWPNKQGTVLLGLDQRELVGQVIAVDAEADCAIVELLEPVDVPPLPLAAAPKRKVVWDGFGFPGVAKGAGLPIDGYVQDADTKDDRGAQSLLLFSEMVAAGQASPLHGFSGSPVLVHGAVVGHFKKHLGDPDDRMRGAYGYVYASPAAAVRALLGDVAIESRDIATPPIETLSDHIPELPKDHFHVFVSYRSTDRKFASSLTRRLEGAGLRVYLAEHEMRPGVSVVTELNHALDNSRSAIAIVSQQWLKSEWCQAEADSLVQRATVDRKFPLIPLVLDDSKLPGLMNNYKRLEVLPGVFEDDHRAGALVEELLWGLTGTPRPSKATPAGRVASGESHAVDNFVSELTLAAKTRDAASVMAVWDDWRRSGLGDISPALEAAELLVGRARPELALAILDTLDDPGLRGSQLRGLALSKSEGRLGDAIAVFERLRAAGHRDPETTGNLAAAYKTRYKRSGNQGALQTAYDLYLECYEQTDDSWNGINAAALGLRLGLLEKSRDLADSVARALEQKARDAWDHWDWATLGEAYLIARRNEKAAECYRQANAKAGHLVRNIAVMREGARDDLEALGEDRFALDACFTVPTVVAFVGHMTDAPGRATERFTNGKVGAVRREIRKRLEKLKPVHGFSGIARGSDIIFIEELLEIGGTPHVILPIPAADFRRTSLGGLWDERFDRLIAKAKPVVLNERCPPDDQLPELFQEANLRVQRRAIEYAKALFGKPSVIAVWDGKPGDGRGGTADAVERWRFDDYDPDVIDLNRL